MQNFLDNLKAQAEANPLLAAGVATSLLHGVAKVIEAGNQRTYAKAHTREIDRRIAANLK